LRQEFIGVTDKKAIKQLKTMNDVCYTKVMEQVGTSKTQMLIFVHSRKETAKTAKYIRDKALELETIGQILRSDAASREVLTEEADSVADRDLKDLLPYGFGIHHAGMSRADRKSVEELLQIKCFRFWCVPQRSPGASIFQHILSSSKGLRSTHQRRVAGWS
jgi:pre-mRNA-splicing helicase BRR2